MAVDAGAAEGVSKCRDRECRLEQRIPPQLRGPTAGQSRAYTGGNRATARIRGVGVERARTQRVELCEGRDVDQRGCADGAAHRLPQRLESAARPRAAAPPRDRDLARAGRATSAAVVAA